MPLTRGYTSRILVKKFNPHHGKDGRFASAPGGGGGDDQYDSDDEGPYGPYNRAGVDRYGNTREAHADYERSYRLAEQADARRAALGGRPVRNAPLGLRPPPPDDPTSFRSPMTPHGQATLDAMRTGKPLPDYQAEVPDLPPGPLRSNPITWAGHTSVTTRAALTSSTPDLTKHSISELARMAQRDWSKGKGVNFAAKPYLSAMRQMEKASDAYGADSGESVISYFLSNASSWRGPVAKQVKDELRRRLKQK